MRNWIRARLKEYEGRSERNDEQLAALVDRHLDALSNRRTLKIYIFVLASANACVWLSVVLFSGEVFKAWTIVTDVNNRIGFVTLAIIFGIGMWLTYSLFRLKFPDIEDQNFEGEMLASYSYSLQSTKRWRIWLFSVIGGVANLILLLLTETCFVAGW